MDDRPPADPTKERNVWTGAEPAGRGWRGVCRVEWSDGRIDVGYLPGTYSTESEAVSAASRHPLCRPTGRWAHGPNRPRRASGITFHRADGTATFMECDWSVDVTNETRDARPGDPEWDGIMVKTISTGRTDGVIRFTKIEDRYRP